MKAEEWAGAAVSFRCPDSGSFQDDARPKKPRRTVYDDSNLQMRSPSRLRIYDDLKLKGIQRQSGIK